MLSILFNIEGGLASTRAHWITSNYVRSKDVEVQWSVRIDWKRAEYILKYPMQEDSHPLASELLYNSSLDLHQN